MGRFLSKISIFIFFLFITTSFLLPTPSFAQEKIIQANNSPTTNANPDVPNNLHNWTQTVMIEVMSSLTCQLAGVDPINPKQSCLGVDQQAGKIGFLPSPQAGGAIGFMGNMITTLYTPPLHTADYFQNLAGNFGISKKTYAQQAGGSGFQSLTSLIGIWSAFRNIVYLMLVIVFVVIGLAIMLRIKIDPRTVMTIQNQIPKIIIGILAVTFSFAIAGFLIDMMWVTIYLTYEIISGIPDVNIESLNPAAIQGQTALGVAGHIAPAGIFGIASDIADSAGKTIASIIGLNSAKTLFPTLGASVIIGSLVGSFIPVIGTIIGGLFGALAPLTAVALGGIVVLIIVIIALLVALFRLWFTLLKAYVEILLAVVVAPFWIIGGIVPGSPISLTGWLKNIGANLLAFPTVIAMFMLGKVFMDIFGNSPTTGQFVPPLIGNPGDQSLMGSLIMLGIILMTPNVVNLLKQMLKDTKIETGIGKAIGAGNPAGLVNKVGQAGFTVGGLANVPGVNRLPFINKLRQGAAGHGTGKT